MSSVHDENAGSALYGSSHVTVNTTVGINAFPIISVIIPAFNEASNIESCLRHLENQTLSRRRFEVILVDNGSSDNTIAKALLFVDQLSLRVVTRSRCRIAALRNYGTTLARGSILAFLDADCLAPPTWLEKALVLAPANSIWGAHYAIPHNSTWVGRTWFAFQASAREGAVSFVPGGNMFITKDCFNRVGGFDTTLETSEDVKICLCAKQLGLGVYAFTSLSVVHEGTPRRLSQFYRQNRWHGTHVVRSFIACLPSTDNISLVFASFYTLAMFWATILLSLVAAHRHSFLWVVTPLGLLLLPAFLLSFVKPCRARQLSAAPKLFVLYLTFFLARAASLARLSTRTHR